MLGARSRELRHVNMGTDCSQGGYNVLWKLWERLNPFGEDTGVGEVCQEERRLGGQELQDADVVRSAVHPRVASLACDGAYIALGMRHFFA